MVSTLRKSQPVKVDLNKKLDPKQKTIQIFHFDAQGFRKTKSEHSPTWEIRVTSSLRSVAGLVIQATGKTEFEDGLRPGSPGGVLSDNPSAQTSSLVTPEL